MSRIIPFNEVVQHIKHFTASLDYVAQEFSQESIRAQSYKEAYEKEKELRERLEKWNEEKRTKIENLENRIKELEDENNKLKDAIICNVCKMSLEEKEREADA